MKSIKYLFVLACMTFGLFITASAQIYSNEIYFYQGVDNPNRFRVIRFENRKILLLSSNVKQNIASSLAYYDNDAVWDYVRRNSDYEYDYNTSTSKYEVYKEHCNGLADAYGNFTESAFMEYRAVSKDLSSYIEWRERDRDGEIYKKQYFIRISKEDLLPKAVNRDFLND